jgi:hypothetical protein
VVDLRLIEYDFGNVQLLWIPYSLILRPVVPDGRLWSAFVGSLGCVGDRDALSAPSLATSLATSFLPCAFLLVYNPSVSDILLTLLTQ